LKDGIDVPGVRPLRHDSGDVSVVGYGFKITRLKEGATAFANQRVAWGAVPRRFDGWSMTQLAYPATQEMRVRARKDTTVYGLAGGPRSIDVTGWQVVEGETIACAGADGDLTLSVYRRELRAGEEVVVPQGSMSGMIVLLPK
jgi:hypothetical protein